MIDQKQQPIPSSSESGFTIIESLVAIIVVSILLAAISPVIVLSVATRVQAKRVELATEAAKIYVEGLRTKTIPAPPIAVRDATATADPSSPDPPSGTLSCSTTGVCSISPTTTSSQLFCVDGDTGGCTNSRDMVIQAFGYNSSSTDFQKGYKLGLRVYRADAFKSGITLKASKDSNVKLQQTFTGGTGLRSLQAPLVEITTEISHGTTTFSDFCDRLKLPANGSNINAQSQC
ncbi:hormogonium polysaccharide secretion pseudopilin HpsB [Scytonema sp. NUACC21]